MIFHSFLQHQRFLTISLLLSVICATPLLFAWEDEAEHDDNTWWGYAYAETVEFTESEDTTVSSTNHTYEILNKTGDDINFKVEFNHTVEKANHGVWTFWKYEWNENVGGGEHYIAADSGVGCSWSTTAGVYTLSAYTAVRYDGEQAKAEPPTIEHTAN